jgi:acyl-CoA synthetase (NDP forming)
VAVIGAGRSPNGIGHTVVRNIIDGGFTGSVYPINPNAESIAGVPCYASLAAIPNPVDLAVLALPAEQCLDARSTRARERACKGSW